MAGSVDDVQFVSTSHQLNNLIRNRLSAFTGNVVSTCPKQVISNTDTGHILRIFPRGIDRARTKAPRGFGNPSPLHTHTQKKNLQTLMGRFSLYFIVRLHLPCIFFKFI